MRKLLIAISLGILLPITLLSAEKKQLIFYCGITMVKPMTEIAKIIEDKHNIKISISQGGSKDLYDSLAYSKKGDLYLPGSDSYINKYEDKGYFGRKELIGHNKAAIFVQKGNPKNIKGIADLIDDSTKTMLCDAEAGSIGKESKNILVNFKDEDFYYDVFDKAVILGTDSRNLNKALKDKIIDATINWKSTAFFPENKNFIDIVEIDENIAKPKKLVLTLLNFSQNKEIANDLIDYAKSNEGQEILRRYGF